MALLGNRDVYLKNLWSATNGTSTAGAYTGNVFSQSSGKKRNAFSTLQKYNSNPVGYRPPYCQLIAQTNGGLGSYKQLSGSLSTTNGNIAGGKNAQAALSASIVLSSAEMGLVVQLLASIAASISVTNASLAAILEMVANTISASGTLNTPILGALASVQASLLASIDVTTASMNNSRGFMTAEITPYTELSPQSLAASLLNSLLADFNDAGTVGEALNSIGAASNPWSSDLSSNTTPGTFGERVQQLLTLAKYMGLK